MTRKSLLFAIFKRAWKRVGLMNKETEMPRASIVPRIQIESLNAVVSFVAVLNVGHISLPTNSCIPQQYIPFQLCQPITANTNYTNFPHQLSLQHRFLAKMPTESLFLANKERSIAILPVASQNCFNFHHFPLKIELFYQDFESHGAYKHQTEVTQQRTLLGQISQRHSNFQHITLTIFSSACSDGFGVSPEANP